MRPMLLLVILLALTGCAGQKTKPTPPVAPPPAIVEVPVEVFVPIDPDLTARCKWRATAPLEEIPSVARERKKCLQFYEANLDAISRQQGKPKPTTKIKPKP